jgi:hypothetical protein
VSALPSHQHSPVLPVPHWRHEGAQLTHGPQPLEQKLEGPQPLEQMLGLQPLGAEAGGAPASGADAGTPTSGAELGGTPAGAPAGTEGSTGAAALVAASANKVNPLLPGGGAAAAARAAARAKAASPEADKGGPPGTPAPEVGSCMPVVDSGEPPPPAPGPALLDQEG